MGKIPGNFFSKDVEGFWDLIEDGVKELVAVLFELGFTPVGSCEGHPNDRFNSNRYVRVAFSENEMEAKQELLSICDKAKENGIKIEYRFLDKPVMVRGDNKQLHHSVYIDIDMENVEEEYSKFVSFLRRF